MKYRMPCRLFGTFYHRACKKALKERNVDPKTVKNEYRRIVHRAKEIGKSKLISSYLMGAYFIALNRATGLSAEENYELYKDGLCASKIFGRVLGNAETYLDDKKLAGRQEWSRKSHLRKYENDWVVDILTKTESFDLGYDYHECGICKLCQDGGCPELATYLCRFDYVLADLMGMELKRTMTIAEGAPYCDFRYSRKAFSNATYSRL